MDEAFLSPEAGLDLTRSILARTSGSPCQRLQDLACAFVDGELDADQGGLVQAHLASCPACAALIAALAGSRQVLPALADLSPGPWFTQRVLRATLHQPPRRSTDLRTLWWKLMHRPRIALEAAYLGAAAGLLGSYLPIPAPSIPLRVPAFVQPLGASAQRVKAQVFQAERRGTQTVQHSLPARATPTKPTKPRPTLWQRGSTWVRSRIQRFRRSQPSSQPTSQPSSRPPAPPQENQAGQANP